MPKAAKVPQPPGRRAGGRGRLPANSRCDELPAIVDDALRTVAPADHIALLPLWSRFGTPAAKEAVQTALQSQNPEVREIGLAAICDWPNASVADELLQLFHAAKAGGERQRWPRAFIRLGSRADTGSDARRLAMLREAMRSWPSVT